MLKERLNIKTLIKTILIFLLTSLFQIPNLQITHSESKICDSWEKDFEATNFEDFCKTWIQREDINWLTNFSGSYIDNSNWYYWTNYKQSSLTNTWNLNWTPNWYLWNKFDKYYEHNQITPVWIYSQYKWVEVIFPQAKEIQKTDNSLYPLVKPTSTSQESTISNSSWNNCTTPPKITKLNLEQKNNWYKEYIELTWNTHNKTQQEEITKIKIIKYLPKYEKIELNNNQTNYKDTNIETDKTHMYTIVTYNNCWWLTYSDTEKIKIELQQQSSDKPYLELETKNQLILKNTEETNKQQQIRLTCEQNNKEIIKEKLTEQNSYKYQLKEGQLKEAFICYVMYYDKENKKQETERYTYIPKKRLYLTSEEVIDLILPIPNSLQDPPLTPPLTGGRIATDEIEQESIQTNQKELYKDIYYLYNQIELEENSTYWEVTLLLINLKWKIYLIEQKQSLEIFKNLWYINNNKKETDNISYEEFVRLLLYINSKDIKDFQEEILEQIEEITRLKTRQVFENLIKIYYINKELGNLRKEEKMLSCLKLEWCEDIEGYIDFMKWIENKLEEVNLRNKRYIEREAEKLWIDLDDENEVTWEEYTKILYRVMWKQEYKKSWYTKQDYEKLIEILKESVFYKENFKTERLNYFEYQKLNLFLLWYNDIQKKIWNIVEKYLEQVLRIYDKLEKREELLIIFSDYLKK